MLRESGTIYGIEMWGLEGGWNEIDKIHSIFCKIILGMPRSVANNWLNWNWGGIVGGGKF
jgi:hypothetical protein